MNLVMQYWRFYRITYVVLVLLLAVSCKEGTKKETSKEVQEESAPSIEKEEGTMDASSTSKRIETSKPVSLDFEKEVEKFIICKKAATQRNDCRNTITKVISKSFGLTEFSDPKLGYVIYDSIQPIVTRSKKWLQLGSVSRESITQAVAHANKGGLALIIDTSASYGHVVMILPGESKKSGSWGMELPNVLSLTNYKPEKSFSDKSLAYAMKKSEDLKIFLRQ